MTACRTHLIPEFFATRPRNQSLAGWVRGEVTHDRVLEAELVFAPALRVRAVCVLVLGVGADNRRVDVRQVHRRFSLARQ